MCCDIGLDRRILDYHVRMSLLGPQDLPDYHKQPRTSLGKWSSSLYRLLLDWTIKQKRQNRNMGYVIYVRICSKSRLFYVVRAGTEQEDTVK